MTQITECVNCSESINVEGRMPEGVGLIHDECVSKLRRNIRRQIQARARGSKVSGERKRVPSLGGKKLKTKLKKALR